MKNVINSVLLGGALLVCASACTKMASQGGSSTSTTPLTVSSATVDRGQPLTVTAPTSITGGIQWFVTPSTTLTHVSSGNGQAVVLFGASGTYHVYAAYGVTTASGVDSTADSVTVVVNDSVYTPPTPPAYDTTSLSSDVVTLTPVIDSNAQLLFIAQTTKSYSGFPTLLYQVSSGPTWSNGLDITFYGVVADGGTGVNNPAIAYLFLNNLTTPADGTYPLVVTVDGTQYTGSITVTGAAYTFNWNYTTGVVISPGSVTR